MATTVRLVPSTIYNAASSYLSITNGSNAYTDTSSSTYATITNTNSSTSSRYIYIRGFNFSSIPADATVTSWTVRIKGYESGGTTSSIYICNGTSTTSAYASGFTSSNNTHTVSNGSLTWANIVSYGSNFGLRINCNRSKKNTTAYYYVYGAEIEVTYTEPVASDVLYVKQNGSWVEVEKAYKKVNGSWVEQSDLTTVFSSGTNYVKGN